MEVELFFLFLLFWTEQEDATEETYPQFQVKWKKQLSFSCLPTLSRDVLVS